MSGLRDIQRRTNGLTDVRTDGQGRLPWTPSGKPGVQNEQVYDLCSANQKGNDKDLLFIVEGTFCKLCRSIPYDIPSLYILFKRTYFIMLSYLATIWLLGI